MDITKNELKAVLRDWQLLLTRLNELQERIKSHCYTVTPRYSAEVAGNGGMVTSKVERYYITRAQIQAELESLERIVLRVSAAINKAGLTSRERELTASTMNGRSLSSYAKEKNIYKTHVYKIRDRALSKILNALKAG